MSKKNKRPKRAKSPPPRATLSASQGVDGESRQSLVITVGWMLALLVTLAAEVVAIPAVILAKANPPAVGPGLSAVHVGNIFLFIALITGLITAGLVPLVYRVRAVPPPQAIVIFALVAGAVPPITMVILWLL